MQQELGMAVDTTIVQGPNSGTFFFLCVILTLLPPISTDLPEADHQVITLLRMLVLAYREMKVFSQRNWPALLDALEKHYCFIVLQQLQSV